MPKPELVVFGNLLVDDIVYDDGTTRMGQPGGAVIYFALAARLFGIDVGIVSVRGEDYPPAMLETLERCGVDLAGVRPLGRPGLRTWLLYEGRLRRVVHRLEGPRHNEVSPSFDDIPESWRQARAFHLAPMPMPQQATLVGKLGRRTEGLISLDPYELLTEGERSPWRRLLDGLDVFFLSEDEMLLDGEPASRLPSLVGGRLKQVVFKRGARGGLLYSEATGLVPWRARASSVVDPTGAGDAFAAGFLAGRLRGEEVRRSLARGVVGASFALEGEGTEALAKATPEAADQRLQDFSQCEAKRAVSSPPLKKGG